MRLLLIRHGQTPANVRGELDTGRPGPGLTALGRAQAASIPAALEGQALDGVFGSLLVRTQETAAPLAAARGLAVDVLDGIHEIEAGELEMATDHRSYKSYLEACIAWGSGDRDYPMPGASDGHAFFERFDASIAQLSGMSSAAVFSHGAAMRVWVRASARNFEASGFDMTELDNTGMAVLEGSPAEGWDLVTWQGTPLGGHTFVDESAADPTGTGADEALA